MIRIIRVLATCLVVFVSTPVIASQQITQDQITATCKTLYDAGELIMQARQAGKPMPDVLNAFSRDDDIFRLIIIDAYEMPAIPDPGIRDEVVREFANRQFMLCMKHAESRR